jgi:hypothetical protein
MLQSLMARFRRLGKGAAVHAATDLPPDPLPTGGKGFKPKQITLPSYLTTAKPDSKTVIPLTERNLSTTDITTYRTGATARKVIRDFVLASPDLSAAVTAYIRTAITNGFKVVAYNPDGTINPEGTKAAQQVITRFDVLSDYTLGYDSCPSILSVSESWVRELRMYGSCAGELVLDKSRLPSFVQPLSTTQIVFYPSTDGRRAIPKQKIGGDEIDLDVPTFFYVSLDQDLQEPYSISPIETAIQPTIFSADFVNDIRRIVKKAIHPRSVYTIDEEQFLKTIPPSVRNNEEEFTAYLEKVISDLETQVNGLQPEEALVLFSSIGVEVVDHGNTNLANEYEVVQGVADAKLATGAGVLPTILGHTDGTSNTASAEVLLFMKQVDGVRRKLNEMWSKVMTLSVRLLGHDVTVKATFGNIELRPESELESFKSQRQSNVLDLLSIGFMTDEEACIELTGHLPPAGFKPLSGTGFRANTSQTPEGDGFNGASNSGSTMNQKTKSDAPKGGGRGSNTKGGAK